MASGKSLSAANLEALGAARLAALLLEISADDAAMKRRLRLALAGNASPAEASREVAKRLASIAKARSFIDGREAKTLAAELDAQRRAILDLIAPANPREAFELGWRLVNCAEPVLSRGDDGRGRLADVFRQAIDDLGPLAQAAKLDPLALAERAFEAIRGDSGGALDGLVAILAPQLGAAGLGRLRQLTEAWQAEPVVTPPESERRVIGWGSTGKLYADQIEAGHRRNTARIILQEVATATGDVDAYVAQFDPAARAVPAVAADIAQRLLDAGRPKEAWKAIEAARTNKRAWRPVEWEQTRIDVLEALGLADEAQASRWECFTDGLAVTHLRAYLRRLPDFEDFDAERRAISHALDFGDVHRALDFLVAWPNLEAASRLVLDRAREFDGARYETLAPAGDALEEKYPLASTLLRRAMVDFALGAVRVSRYKHAARHLAECASLARRVADFGGRSDHDDYVKALRAAHGRKSAFWQELTSLREPGAPIP
jgi:uncharacterized protein DUF6880